VVLFVDAKLAALFITALLVVWLVGLALWLGPGTVSVKKVPL